MPPTWLHRQASADVVARQGMFAGALLGAMGVSLTGYALANPIVLTITMTGLAFFFSMLVVYGNRGATIGLACMTLAIITMPSGLTPDKVVGYSLVSVAGALGYIAYSMVSGKLLQLREERQALSVALFATAQYLRARARMYENGVDIDRGYRAMITTQAQMIAAHQGARDAMLGHMSTQSVGKSRARLMLWNVMVDMSALVDLVISTQTDYTLLHQRLQKSPALGFMRGALAGMADELDRLMVAVGSGKPVLALQAPDNHLHRLASELQTLKDSGFALTEPETYAIAAHICQRLTKMQEIVQRMASQPETAISRQTVAKPLQPTFLEQSLSSLMSTQSFSLKLFASNLTLGSAAFRYALRVSLGVALAMVAGMYVPDTGAHGYWIALTVIVIMKPAYSLSQQRNANRLIGTLLGCALVFGLLHITTNSNILLGVFAVAFMLCFVFFVTSNYRIYSMFVSITVLLALHAILPHTENLPTERAIDTVIGSLIALACSHVLPWWESRSLPGLAANAIKANQRLLRATIGVLRQVSPSPEQSPEISWQGARHNMQIAFSNFVQGFARMMAEPSSKQVHVSDYNSLVVLVHVMAAELVNTLKQAELNPSASEQIASALEEIGQALDSKNPTLIAQPATRDTGEPLPDWAYAVRQLRESTREIVATTKAIGI
ncbi:MAG: FUSC family protein [Burkholderiaceae bacterium]|nr:FUSC family protein [Burkholderiaceae bacterium]